MSTPIALLKGDSQDDFGLVSKAGFVKLVRFG